MWLKSLKISSVLILLILFSCHKKKYPEMKIGYYNVIDERLYPNGDTDTLYYKMVGPIMHDANFGFIGELNGEKIGRSFLLPNGRTTYVINSEYVIFFITAFSVTITELIVHQESDDSLGYTNKMTLTYIE